MKYLVYKITNNVNSRTYVGVHQTEDVNDNYMGSGTLIRAAIAKYGVEHFTKEILHEFTSAEEMYKKEADIVNVAFVNDKSTYNLVVGGANALAHVNANMDDFKSPEQRTAWAKQGRLSANSKGANVKGSQRHHELLKTSESYREQYLANLRESKQHSDYNHRDFKHSDEVKRKISEANSIKQAGENNSQFGTCWITNSSLQQNKKIKLKNLPDLTDDGWQRGRKTYK